MTLKCYECEQSTARLWVDGYHVAERVLEGTSFFVHQDGRVEPGPEFDNGWQDEYLKTLNRAHYEKLIRETPGVCADCQE